MMTREAAKSREQMEMFCLDDLVPKDHLVRKNRGRHRLELHL